MLVVLRHVANINNVQMRFAVCQLQQDLVQIAKIYQDRRNNIKVAARNPYNEV